MAPAPAAHAGAWVAPENQEILTSITGERNGVSFFESSGYWEVPFSEETSVVAAPWVEQNYDTVDGWRAEATLGVKRTIFESGSSVVALQAGGLWMSHPDSSCEDAGGELRLLGGASFGRSGFLNIEAAARTLGGGCTGERLDLTLGYRPADDWMAMGQVFLDAPHQGEESVKAQLTLVRFGADGGGLQVGVRARIDDGPEEAALVIGLWGRPGD